MRAIVASLGFVALLATHGASAAQYWYYCDDSGAYYPYVQTCRTAWREIQIDPDAMAKDRAEREAVRRKQEEEARLTEERRREEHAAEDFKAFKKAERWVPYQLTDGTIIEADLGHVTRLDDGVYLMARSVAFLTVSPPEGRVHIRLDCRGHYEMRDGAFIVGSSYGAVGPFYAKPGSAIDQIATEVCPR